MSKYRFTTIGILALGLHLSPYVWSENLDHVMKQALHNHPQVLIGLKRMQISREKVDRALSEYWPTLDFNMAAGVQKRWLPPSQQTSPTSTHDNSYTRKEGSISFKQNVFSGFYTKNNVEKTRHLTSAETHEMSSSFQDLALKVITAYMQVLESLELIELAEGNVEFHNKVYEKIKKKTNHGLVGISDLIQIGMKQAQSKANLINSHINLESARTNYYSIVGVVADEKLLPPNIDRLKMPQSFSDSLKLSNNEHPAVIRANYQIQAAESDYAANKSRYFPKLDLEIDQTWKTNVDGQQDTTTDLVAMAKISYNIFRGGADLSLVKESAYMVEESRAKKTLLMREIEEKLRRAWDNHELLVVEIRYLRQQEADAIKLVKVFRDKFNLGRKGVMDVLDAENELLEVSRNVINSTYAEMLSRYEILASSGQLLKEFKLVWNDDWTVEEK